MSVFDFCLCPLRFLLKLVRQYVVLGFVLGEVVRASLCCGGKSRVILKT